MDLMTLQRLLLRNRSATGFGCCLVMLSTHKKCNTSLCFSDTATIRNAFSMLAVGVMGWALNLRSKSSIFWSNFSPACKQSVRDDPFAYAEASYTIQSLRSPCHVELLYDEVANAHRLHYPRASPTQLCLAECVDDCIICGKDILVLS